MSYSNFSRKFHFSNLDAFTAKMAKKLSHHWSVSFELLKCASRILCACFECTRRVGARAELLRKTIAIRIVGFKKKYCNPRARLVRELFASVKIECVTISPPVRYCAQNLSV